MTTVETRLAHEPGVLGVTGAGPIEQDYSHAVFGHFPEMFAVIALLTFLLLARAFRSAVLAAKAVLLNLLSLAATFGVLTWFWQEGHGSQAIFGIPATGAITFWVPLMIFAFLFGLSMDYEVFILTRVREEYDRTGNTNEAVVEGLGSHGPSGHVRRPHTLPGLHVTGLGTGHRHKGPRHRAGRGHRPRRHIDQGVPRPGAGGVAGALELVDAPAAGPSAPVTARTQTTWAQRNRTSRRLTPGV